MQKSLSREFSATDNNGQFTSQIGPTEPVHSQTQEQRHDLKVSANQPNSKDAIQTQSSLTMSALSIRNVHVLLATARVTVYTAQGEPLIERALLDNGSQVSFMTDRLVTALGHTAYINPMSISGTTQAHTNSNKMVDITLQVILCHFTQNNM